MKLLLISSSPRKEHSSTYKLAAEVLRGAEAAGAETQTIHLCGARINFCRACDECHKKSGACPMKDDADAILVKMLMSDGIIFASPNYINQVTASLKALFDRSSHFIHCKRLLGKYAAGVVSSGSGEDAAVLDYMKYYSNVCGAQYSGGVSSRPEAGPEKMEEAYNLGLKLVSDIKEKASFPGQLEFIELGKRRFCGIIKKRKGDWLEEYQYWEDKGWLEGPEKRPL